MVEHSDNEAQTPLEPPLAAPATDVEAASPPLARLAATAAAADPKAVSQFKPGPLHHAVAGALFAFDRSPPTSFKELAIGAGITESQFQTILKHPEACNWIVSHSANIARFGLAAVYSRLLNMALTAKSPQWALLFLRRFDPEMQRQATPVAAVQINHNTFSDYSTQELEAHLAQKRRKRYGESKVIEAEAS